MRYQPIDQLPNAPTSEIVLWDSGSDLLVMRVVGGGEADDYRRDGRFTHFLVLPSAHRPEEDSGSELRNRGLTGAGSFQGVRHA